MWHRSLLDTVNQANHRGLCLYGAGFWGEITYKVFVKMGHVPLCFCDDAEGKWNHEFQGLPVYSLKDAVQRYPNAVFLVCKEGRKSVGRNPIGFQNMIEKLKKYGVYDCNSELRVSLYWFLLEIEELSALPNDEEMKELVHVGDIKKLLLLNHMSRSGSYYLEQLFDGHPDILELPFVDHVLVTVYEKRLKYLNNEELLIEMAAQMADFFHSSYEKKFMGNRGGMYSGQVVDANGECIFDALVSADEFMKFLRMQFVGRDICLDSLGHMMKVFAATYNDCLNRKRKDCSMGGFWILYHMHEINWEVSKTYQYFSRNDFSRIENLFIIREPIQQLYSFLRYSLNKNRANLWVKNDEAFSHVMKSEMGYTLEKRDGIENVQVVRIEDLKAHPYATMLALCKWLNIDYQDILSITTVNHIQVYYPAMTENGVKYITGNNTMAVKRKNFSEYLTLWDEARLNMVYAKFKRAYGYQNDVPEFTEFSISMLECMLKQDFRFASECQKLAVENGDLDASFNVNEFVKGLYIEYMKNYEDGTEYYGYIKPLLSDEN